MSAITTTSRVGRKPVMIPSGVDIKVVEQEIVIKGPKGQLEIPLHPYVNLELHEGKVNVLPNTDAGYCRSGSGKKLKNAVPGTMRSQINNAVLGVTKGFERKLTLVGVGYRAQVKGSTLHLTIGYSHPVEFTPPAGVVIEAPNLTEILIKGTNKHLVGHTTAKIQEIRPPEPYKGKGIIDPLKRVIRKETKKK
jgi:large subunit ribosomal protein L6